MPFAWLPGRAFPVPAYSVLVKYDGWTDPLALNLLSLTFEEMSIEIDYSALRFQLAMPMHIFWFFFVIVVCLVGLTDPIFRYSSMFSIPGVILAMGTRFLLHLGLGHVPYRNRKLYVRVFVAFNLWVWIAWWRGLEEAMSGGNAQDRVSSVAMTCVWQCSLTVYTTFMQFFTLTFAQR